MNTKPVAPALHGIIDYVFSGILLAAPSGIGLNEKVTKTYQALGTSFLGINALTDTPVGIKRVISFKGHQMADAAFLAGLSLLTLVPFIRKDKQALGFHLSFLGTALTHYVLTDYEADPQTTRLLKG